MKKPLRTFHVALWREGKIHDYCAIYGETFFAARAAMAVLDRIEPGAIRLDPPARLS